MSEPVIDVSELTRRFGATTALASVSVSVPGGAVYAPLPSPRRSPPPCCAEGGLTVERTGRPAARYVPEAVDIFFVAGQPRTRRIFRRDERGRVTGFVDRREGEDVRWVKGLY